MKSAVRREDADETILYMLIMTKARYPLLRNMAAIQK